MKHLGLFAFGVTTCVLVPTALHLLEAGPNQVAKLVAPALRTLAMGKAKVEISVDRGIVDPGKKVHVTLTATAETHQRVTVAVLVYESEGTGGGRVESPPQRVGRDEVTLDIVNGTATKQLAFTLPGTRGQNMEGQEPFGHYTILVMPTADADKLETLRRRADKVGNPMEDRGGQYGRFEEAYRSLGEEPSEGSDRTAFGTPGQIARLDVNTRPESSPITIIAPEAARVGDDLAITVRVKNPTNKPAASLTITLESKPGYGIANDYLGIDDDHVVITDGTRTESFAGNETKELVFHVKATTSGVLGLYARTSCNDQACYGNDDGGRLLSDVALDAVDIAPAEHPVVVVQ